MTVKKGATSPQSSSRRAGTESAGPAAPRPTRMARGPGSQAAGRKLSPGEIAILQAMIAEAEAMRRRLNAGD